MNYDDFASLAVVEERLENDAIADWEEGFMVGWIGCV